MYSLAIPVTSRACCSVIARQADSTLCIKEDPVNTVMILWHSVVESSLVVGTSFIRAQGPVWRRRILSTAYGWYLGHFC